MKKMLVTLGLAAGVVSSLFATSPAQASDIPQMLPAQIQPNLGDLQLKPILPLSPQLLILLPKAELTSRVTVVPSPFPGARRVWCYVKNSGLKHSGAFLT